MIRGKTLVICQYIALMAKVHFLSWIPCLVDLLNVWHFFTFQESFLAYGWLCIFWILPSLLLRAQPFLGRNKRSAQITLMMFIWGNLNASWTFCSVKIDTLAWTVVYVESVYERDATSKVLTLESVNFFSNLRGDPTLRCQILVITQCSMQTQTYAGQLARKKSFQCWYLLRYNHQQIIQLLPLYKNIPSKDYFHPILKL